MVIVVENLLNDLDSLKKRLDRSVSKNDVYIKDLESRKDNLSVHGHWDLGYHIGNKAAKQDVIDMLDEVLEKYCIEK